MTRTIGASTAAAVLGLSPFESPLQAWMRLTDRVPPARETGPMLRGTLLEPGLRQWYAAEVGAEVVPGPTLAEPGWRVSEHVHARPDAWRVTDGGCITGEIKSVNAFAHRAKWSEGVPVWYLVQALTQMAAEHPDGLRIVSCELVAYVTDSAEPTIYSIDRDERRQGALVERLDRFMRDHVVADRAPEPRDESERLALLASMEPTEVWIEPTDDDRALVARLAEARRMERDGKADGKRITAELLARCGTAQGLTGLVRGSFVKGRLTVDAKALRKAHAEIFAQFTRTGAPSRSWRLLNQTDTDSTEE